MFTVVLFRSIIAVRVRVADGLLHAEKKGKSVSTLCGTAEWKPWFPGAYIPFKVVCWVKHSYLTSLRTSLSIGSRLCRARAARLRCHRSPPRAQSLKRHAPASTECIASKHSIIGHSSTCCPTNAQKTEAAITTGPLPPSAAHPASQPRSSPCLLRLRPPGQSRSTTRSYRPRTGSEWAV